MKKKPECIIEILGEGGRLSISRVTIGQEHRYLTNHQEHDFLDEGLEVSRQIGYSSFDEAFSYISKYPWHLLFLHTVHQDYRTRVLDRLMEVLNREFEQGIHSSCRKMREYQEVFHARIYRASWGEWRYTLEDPGHPATDKSFK